MAVNLIKISDKRNSERIEPFEWNFGRIIIPIGWNIYPIEAKEFQNI